MSVYFVYRSQYSTPNLNHVKKFDDSSVLDWFRKHWVEVDDASKFSKELLGCYAYGFGSIFENIAEHNLAPPETIAELQDYLKQHLYVEGTLLFQPHVVQVLTDDDELDVAYYIFDDEFLAENRGKASFLLQDNWQLPVAFSTETFTPAVETKEFLPKGTREGTVYLVFLSAYDSGENLVDTDGSWHIDGIRLPDLSEYLGTHELKVATDGRYHFPSELFLLRSQLLIAPESSSVTEKQLLSDLQDKFAVESLWGAYTKWLTHSGHENPGQLLLERALTECCKFPVHDMELVADWKGANGKTIGLRREELKLEKLERWNNDPSKSLIQVSAHMAQISVHTDRWGDGPRGVDLYNRWIIFDDQWAAANVDLANSILVYGDRWDVLS